MLSATVRTPVNTYKYFSGHIRGNLSCQTHVGYVASNATREAGYFCRNLLLLVRAGGLVDTLSRIHMNPNSLLKD